MERWVQLWILGLVAIVPGKAALDLTGIHKVNGIWRAPATLPCVYEPSHDFKQLKVTWKFFRPGEASRSIVLHDAFGDHIFLAAFRNRVNIAQKPPGDVSLHIKELEMTDIGSFTCLVEWEAQNMSRITREKTLQLKVVKVPASKPVIKASSQESVLLSGTQMNLTCSANGSPPINYRWYKEVPGGEAKELQRSAVLDFDDLQVLDSAKYFCTAENRLNVQKEQSISFQLTVEAPGPQKKALPLYVIILIAVLSVAFTLMVISVVFCRRRTKSDNIYEVTYNNNALTLGNEDIPATPEVISTCVYEEPNSSFGNNYTMDPTKAAEYVVMGEKMDNEYEILVAEKQLGN